MVNLNDDFDEDMNGVDCILGLDIGDVCRNVNVTVREFAPFGRRAEHRALASMRSSSHVLTGAKNLTNTRSASPRSMRTTRRCHHLLSTSQAPFARPFSPPALGKLKRKPHA
jgi:hypothetical protein